METSDIIASAALVLSMMSIIISSIQFRKNYKITKKQNDERDKKIESYLFDAFLWEEEKEYIFIAIAYTNNSTLNSTIKSVELEIDFYDEEKILKKIKISLSEDVDIKQIKPEAKKMGSYLNFSPLETKSGWLTFQIPELIRNNLEIERYRVISTTNIEEKIVNEIFIVKKVENDEA